MQANDLGAVFMELAYNRIEQNGKYGMINQAAWLFKPAYQAYRNHIIEDDTYHLNSALYLGPNTFPELKGEVVQSVSFIASKSEKTDSLFFYLKKGSNSYDKKVSFLNKNCGVYKHHITQFQQFAGSQFGFWLNPIVITSFRESPIRRFGDAKQGLKTGNNHRFIRLWYEISKKSLNYKWFPVETGGEYRKWYGNGISVLNWENDGYEIKNFKDENGKLKSRPQGLNYSFTNGITWSTSAGERPSFRYSDDRYLFESSGSKFFALNKSDDLSMYCAYFNSYVVKSFIEMFSPGLGVSEGAIKSLPYIIPKNIEASIPRDCIGIAKQDWDAHETSWDFKENELIRMKHLCGMNSADLDLLSEIEAKEIKLEYKVGTNGSLIEHCYRCYVNEWSNKFHQLHSNEEELNRQFIEIYGLQDELTPDVPLNEITILQQGEIKIEDNQLKFQSDVLIKQLLSYAIGCWMGRYRLDKPGLNIAHPNPTEEEVCTYQYNGCDFEIDSDGIIPLMGCDSMFEDNAYNRIVSFLKIAFGEDSLTENLNFIENALGKSVEDYLVKDFWKDHKKMYQNRPVYWLFSSKKGAFQVLVYMHRMNPYTAERVRTQYLLKHIEDLKGRIATASERAAMLTSAQRKDLARMQKVLDECLEYHDVLHEFADRQVGFDLDDGVVVNYAKFGNVLAKLK